MNNDVSQKFSPGALVFHDQVGVGKVIAVENKPGIIIDENCVWVDFLFFNPPALIDVKYLYELPEIDKIRMEVNELVAKYCRRPLEDIL